MVCIASETPLGKHFFFFFLCELLSTGASGLGMGIPVYFSISARGSPPGHDATVSVSSYVSVLLCPEDMVSLDSSILSGSYNCSAMSSTCPEGRDLMKASHLELCVQS